MKNPALGSCFVLLVLSLSFSAAAEPFQMVSSLASALPPPSGGSGDSSSAVISPDGRFVLFASTANNLVLTTNNTPIPSPIPAALNVFLRDRTNNTTTLVSINLSGAAGGNADSLPVEISADGRYALFESSASDLTPNDTNNATDVFVRDLLGGTTTLVSVSTNGVPGNGASRSPAMTPDAHFVTFVSAANNLVAGDRNRIPDVFVRDLQAGTTVLVSVGAVSTNSTIPTGSSEAPAITPDGRYVAFMSTATNLVPGVPAGGDVYVRDLVAGTTIWASTGARAAAATALGSSAVGSFNHAVSADGQYVAYEVAKNPSTSGLILRYNLTSGITDPVYTNAAVVMGPFEEARSLDMTPDGRFVAFVANTNGTSGASTCICVWDAQSSSLTVASVDQNGQVSATSISDWPTITPDGRFVAFLSSASNLTANPFTGTYHLYVRDLQAGTTSLLDADTNGLGSAIGPSTIPRLSADGRFAAFDAPDGSLVPNDRNRNNDVFVRDLVASSTELISPHAPALASASPNGPSSLASGAISPDGRFIAFASEADNLTLNDTNGCRDIFLRDYALSAPLLVSVNTNGFTGHGPSTDPSLSSNGRFVAFTSAAEDLIPGDTNHPQDVLIRDLQTGTTILVSINSTGTGPGNKASYSACLSSDGRYVLFRSVATDLAPGTFSGENLFLRDLKSGSTYALTTGGVALSGMLPDASVVAFIGRAPGSATTNFYVWTLQSSSLVYSNAVDPLAACRSLVLSRDGNRFAYSTLSAGSLGGRLYLADLQAGTNSLVDAATAAVFPGMRFSRDGLLLAYTKFINTTNQLCLYDIQTTITSVFNEGYSPPAMPSGIANSLDISPDARFIVYRSPATNGLPNPANNIAQLFLYDRQAGKNTLLTTSRYTGGASGSLPLVPCFSDDGQSLIFQSWASDLFSQDFNQSSDVFAFTFFYLAISNTNAPNQGPRLSWPAVAGANYRVQFTDRLPTGTWEDLNGAITNFANKAWLQDPTPPLGQRFYRVYSF
jgi:Tol biopolymer transport system component